MKDYDDSYDYDPDEEELTEEEIKQRRIEWEINTRENDEDCSNTW